MDSVILSLSCALIVSQYGVPGIETPYRVGQTMIPVRVMPIVYVGVNSLGVLLRLCLRLHGAHRAPRIRHPSLARCFGHWLFLTRGTWARVCAHGERPQIENQTSAWGFTFFEQ
jgi:hypothetical protein